jgi:hypothetical protein
MDDSVSFDLFARSFHKIEALLRATSWLRFSSPSKQKQTGEDARCSNLLRTPGKRQQRNIASLLDGPRQTALMRRAHAGQASRGDLATLGHELRQQTHVFVIDRFNLLDAELANFFAPEIFAATFARSARTATRGPRAAWWTTAVTTATALVSA